MNSRPIAVLLALACSTPVMAQDGPDEPGAVWEAHRLYRHGMELYREADYRAAIRLFQRSFGLSEHPNNLYYIGESYRRLGLLRESYRHYERYARTLPEQQREEFRTRLEQKLRLGRGATVSVTTSPAGARVLVDGQQRGTTSADGAPLFLPVGGGQHRVHVELSDHHSQARSVEIEYGEPAALHFALRPATRPPLLVVKPNVPGARVVLDGKEICTAPLKLDISAGQHRVGVVKEGYGAFEKPIVARRDGVTVVEPRMRPLRIRAAAGDPAGADTGPFLYAMGGPSFTDYGDASLESTASAEGGLRLGYLWRLNRRVGLHVDLSALYAPIKDHTTGELERNGFLLLMGGGGLRLYVHPQLWVGGRLGVGAALLLGASEDGVFFRDPDDPGRVVDASGTFTLLALRPELTLGWAFRSGLTVFLSPAAFDYSHRLREFSPRITKVIRYHLAVGAGWQW
jgi:hypothetical protein